ncbi:Receptor-like protein EIX2 [Linum grandiflorum]
MRLFCYGTYGVSCHQAEREALLTFKSDLQDPSRRLSSWVNGSRDCCKWSGVICDDLTGHVTELHLRSPDSFLKRSRLKVEASQLKHLRYLDLSDNDFQGISIPRFLGSITSLQTLYLDKSGFGGLIPHQLGNLSNLLQLGLTADDDDYVLLYADSLQWLSGLPSLEYLDLDKVDLSIASDWLNMINSVQNLSSLYLSGCRLSDAFPLDHVNMSSLSVLDLSFNQFGPSSFRSWVSHLKSLTSFSLRANNLGGPVPEEVSHLKSLTYLDLRANNLIGPVPDELRNLTSLRALILSENKFNGTVPNWLFGFRHLKELDFHGSNLAGDVSNGIGNMTSLVNLDLSLNYGLKLEGGIPASFKRFCHLKSLALSYVKLQQSVSEVLQILEECSSGTLERLTLSGCELFGQLTDRIGKFKRLKRLWLDDNSISGPLPVSFGELISVDHVSIARNQINGTIPTSFGKLADLVSADISQNLMEGVVSEIHFANLKKLTVFHAAGNKIVFKAKPDWVPPRVLQILDMSSWQLGPGFPKWLQSMQYIGSLDLSNTGISESVPDWFWNMGSPFYYLNLSHNQIPGRLPGFVPSRSSDTMFDVSWNHLEGPLPVISSNLTALDLSNNFLSGNLFKFLCFNPAQARDTEFLNLQGNFLSGEIPECWRTWGKLKVVRLGSNKLRGSIPSSIGTLSSLLSLRIQNNSLTGEIPLSLGNCTSIVSIDLGDNKLEGNIPKWIGERLSKLAILNLRGNKFMGYVPEKLCHLQLLQILNLSHNYLSGNLPECVANFSAMAYSNNEDQGVIYLFFGGAKTFVEYQILVAQGQVKSYSTILNYVRSLDLSCNNFSGEIPKQITSLVALHYLNLSHNSLSGCIPENLDAMESLESLDISENQLSGAIPSGMASLTFLNHLNLSYNNLSGRIPSSTQLQSFDPSSFIGNKGLCGSPLNVSCSIMNLVPGSGEGNGDYDLQRFSMSIMFGFAFGFWGIVGSIEVSERWRELCFGVLDRIGINTQLQSFDPSSFVGNPGLCGSPLNGSCSGKKFVTGSGGGLEDYGLQRFCISVVMGFLVRFW